MPTSKNVSNLVINKVESQAVYDYMKATGLVNDNELYVVFGEDKIDASSITGMDTYLSDNYCVRSVSGSYAGNTSNKSTFTTIDKLKSGGRKIQLPFEPILLTLKGATFKQGTGDIYKINDDNIFYIAYLEGSILYVAHSYSDTETYNMSGETYNWTALTY